MDELSKIKWKRVQTTKWQHNASGSFENECTVLMSPTRTQISNSKSVYYSFIVNLVVF